MTTKLSKVLPGGRILLPLRGIWDADTNNPTLSDGTGTDGEVYLVGIGGTRDLGSGDITFIEGDWIVHNGSVWQRNSNTNFVISINTQTGIVTLTASDVGAEPAFVKNTAFNKDFGTEVGTICQGNDSRLSDARTPTAHDLASHSDTGGFSNANPLMNGTVNQGTSDRVSRQDHVHPVDTSRATSDHTHGNINNLGRIGTTSGLPVITTADGAVTTGTFGTEAGTFCAGDDSRLTSNGVEYVDVPATPTSTGIQGQRAYADNYVYECIATDTWVRYAAESTWS